MRSFFLVKDRCFSCPSFPRKTVPHCWALFCQGDTCAGGGFLIGLPLALCRSRHSKKNMVAYRCSILARVDVIAGTTGHLVFFGDRSMVGGPCAKCGIESLRKFFPCGASRSMVPFGSCNIVFEASGLFYTFANQFLVSRS